ncbi:MAG TPA: DUF2303 family protein [Solirubrobacterales bacterium]
MDLKEIIASLLGLVVKPEVVSIDGRDVLLAPDNWGIHSLEEYRDGPDRVSNTITMTGMESFNDYVNRFKLPASTVFIAPNLAGLASNATLATAIIDYHENDGNNPADAKHLSHRALLQARPSIAYGKLLALDGKLLAQDEFARALEDIARFSSSHAAADLLEIARTLSLTSKGDFKSFEEEFSGSVDFKFDLQVRANAGTQERKLSVPSHIGFFVPLIEGMSDVSVQVKFLYRVPDGPGGKVQLGIKIVDRVWLEDNAIRDAADFIREKTDLPVYVGTVA